LGIEAKLRNYELTEMAIRRMETGRPSSALADRPIGLPVGNWMYGKHQAAAKRKVSDQVQGGSEAADTATDNLVEARFKRVMANRRR
jgi:hypothetical protein